MHRPSWTHIASILALLLLLSACDTGGSTAPAGDEAAGGEADQAAQDQAAQDDEGGAVEPAATTQITIQHMETPPSRVDAFQAVIDGFNESQDRFEVSQQSVGWDEAYPRATAQISAGEAPDLLQAIPAFFTTIRETDAVQPATEIYEELADRHSFIDAYTDQYRWDGEVWAVPAFGMVEGLWYNAAQLEEAGLTPPSTWEEMLAAAEQLTGDGQYGVAVPTGDSFATVQAIYTWMGAAGAGDIYGDNCEVIVDNPQTVEAFDFYNRLAAFSPPDSTSYGWAEVEGALVAQRASMITFKGSFLNAWQNDSGMEADDLGVVPIPKPEGGQDFTLSYSNAFMVMTDDPEKQEGITEFLDFFLQPEQYGTWLGTAEPGLFLPVTENGEEAAQWWEAPIISAFEDEMRTQLELSRVGQLYGFTQDSYCPQVGEFEGQFLLGKAVERMIVDDLSPEEAVDWLAEEMRAIDG